MTDRPPSYRTVRLRRRGEPAAFLAAVEFKRIGRTIRRDPDYENCRLDEFPDMNWWRYRLRFQPQRIFEGRWPPEGGPLEQSGVVMETRAPIALSTDTRWIGILATPGEAHARPRAGAARGGAPVLWCAGLAIRRGKIIDMAPSIEGGIELGHEQDAERIVRRYLETHGYLPSRAAAAAPPRAGA